MMPVTRTAWADGRRVLTGAGHPAIVAPERGMTA
jgi:hypothetical protein